MQAIHNRMILYYVARRSFTKTGKNPGTQETFIRMFYFIIRLLM